MILAARSSKRILSKKRQLAGNFNKIANRRYPDVVMSAYGAAPVAGTRVVSWKWAAGANQEWDGVLHPATQVWSQNAECTWLFYNRANSSLLLTKGADKKLTVEVWNGQPSQLWKYTPTTGRFLSMAGGKLDASYGHEDGDQLQTDSFTSRSNGDNERWDMVRYYH